MLSGRRFPCGLPNKAETRARLRRALSELCLRRMLALDGLPCSTIGAIAMPAIPVSVSRFAEFSDAFRSGTRDVARPTDEARLQKLGGD
jgi:hypothetical protein